MSAADPFSHGLRDMVLRLAGETGQVSLARSGNSVGLRACVDQHVCEIRDALTRQGRKLTPAPLSYAQGFAEAAIGRGWWPPHRREQLGAAPGPWDDSDEPALDWESLRLAAVCRMLIEAQGLAA